MLNKEKKVDLSKVVGVGVAGMDADVAVDVAVDVVDKVCSQ